MGGRSGGRRADGPLSLLLAPLGLGGGDLTEGGAGVATGGPVASSSPGFASTDHAMLPYAPQLLNRVYYHPTLLIPT